MNTKIKIQVYRTKAFVDSNKWISDYLGFVKEYTSSPIVITEWGQQVIMDTIYEDIGTLAGGGEYAVRILQDGICVATKTFTHSGQSLLLEEETLKTENPKKQGVEWQGRCSSCSAITTLTSPSCYFGYSKVVKMSCGNCKSQTTLNEVYAYPTVEPDDSDLLWEESPANENPVNLNSCNCTTAILLEFGCQCGGEQI